MFFGGFVLDLLKLIDVFLRVVEFIETALGHLPQTLSEFGVPVDMQDHQELQEDAAGLDEHVLLSVPLLVDVAFLIVVRIGLLKWVDVNAPVDDLWEHDQARIGPCRPDHKSAKKAHILIVGLNPNLSKRCPYIGPVMQEHDQRANFDCVRHITKHV